MSKDRYIIKHYPDKEVYVAICYVKNNLPIYGVSHSRKEAIEDLEEGLEFWRNLIDN